MVTYIAMRLASLIPTLIGVVTVIFLLMRLIPGDPAEFILGDYATEQSLARLRSQMGLDLPIIQQYGIFMYKAVQGDLGRSLVSKQPAMQEVLRVFPHSLVLSFSGVLIAAVLGIPLGILSAIRQNTYTDYGAMTFALFGISMPTFWLGIVAILLFSFYLPIFPAIGVGDTSRISNLLYHLVLPAGTLGLAATAQVARLTRSSMLEVVRQDYIRTAQAKGVREIRIIAIHAFRNAMIPVLAMIGLLFGWALGSSIIIETVFSRPGLGLVLIKAIGTRDYPVVQAGVAVLSMTFVMINFTIDLLFAMIDPRIRYSS